MKRLAALAISLLFPLLAAAEEGMWLPHQMPQLEDELAGLGLEMDAGKLADLNGHPMNAIIGLGFCSASFVSPEGLAVTNHHCAYGAIQRNSTPEKNYLDNGFLAEERADELPAGPSSRIYVTESLTDVTSRVRGGISADAAGGAYHDAIERAKKEIVKDCEADGSYRCNVAAYHGGLEYRLIRQLEIKDVRLVHAPPEAVGKFGGDVDNWMWPRHTGDYSFFRAYVGPDGRPAGYSEDNVPFEPEHHLRVSADGLEKGDFVMVAGYPGSTNRYRLAREVETAVEWHYPTRIAIFEEWLATIDRATAEDKDAELKYASTVAGLNNAMKNYRGMLDGFEGSRIIENRRAREQALADWIRADADRREAYAGALERMNTILDEQAQYREKDLYIGLVGRASDMLSTARRLYRLSHEQQKPDMKRESGYQKRDMPMFKARLKRLDREFAPKVERAVVLSLLERYHRNLIGESRLAPLDDWFGLESGEPFDREAVSARLDGMYARTSLTDTEKRLAWMDREPEAFESSEDPFIRLAVDLYESDRARENRSERIAGQLMKARPQYLEAFLAWKRDRGEQVYPDANGTLRLTFGTVKGYSPRDAVNYQPFTSLSGIREKHTGEKPFNTPDDVLAAIDSGEYGDYSVTASAETVPVNFLSTVDTTGGNSGSATMNGQGELVGLLFDGNYESINADWAFQPKITRSIHVDVRYMLWLMDSVHGADHLLEEMGVDPSVK